MQSHIITLPQTGFVRQPLLVGDARTGTPGVLPKVDPTVQTNIRLI